MEEVQTTAPVVEGSPEGTGPQVTENSAQAATPQQETTQDQGRDQGQPTSSQTPSRPKVSDFFGVRELRKQIADQGKLIQQLVEQRQQNGSNNNPNGAPNAEAKLQQDLQELKERFYNDPVKFQIERDKRLNEEFERKWQEREKDLLENKVPEILDSREKGREQTGRQQEALELIFPKGNSAETLEQRIKKDPVRAGKIVELMEKYGLNEASVSKPKEIAELVLKLYALESNGNNLPKKAPVVTKAQAGPTSTGTPVGANGGRKMTLDEIRAEKQRLETQKAERPELMFDDAFRAKWNTVKTEYETLISTERKVS